MGQIVDCFYKGIEDATLNSYNKYKSGLLNPNLFLSDLNIVPCLALSGVWLISRLQKKLVTTPINEYSPPPN